MENQLSNFLAGLKPTQTVGAQVEPLAPATWRLEVPAGPAGKYRLAQLDDYGARRRRNFPWQPPVRLRLRARASAADIPGTWGFGLWNDPFGMAVLSGAEGLRLPALPNAAWFFFASPPNYLSLRDDLPAQGALAATFQAPRWPSALLALGAPAVPLLLFRRGVRLLRRLAQRWVRQSAARLEIDPTIWHHYEIVWRPGQVTCAVDGVSALDTPVAPLGPLGLVLWIDNQYAALTPQGRLQFGTLPCDRPAWVELEVEQFEFGG